MLRTVDILRAMTTDRESVRDHVDTVRHMLRTAPTPSHGGDGVLFRRMDGADGRLRDERRVYCRPSRRSADVGYYVSAR